MTQGTAKIPFTGQQKFVILMLALTQFTVILDFMVMSPLGEMIMRSMSLTPRQFGLAVSGYAVSAGISGLLTAGFADRFDRKRLLMFFYGGFILGTIACGLSTSYYMLLGARIVTGIFGGVIGSISMAIVTDLFDIHHRGRVMGFVQMGFGASQVLGIPISLWIATKLLGWQAPFLMVAGLALLTFLFIAVRLQPVRGHLALQHDRSPLAHLWQTVAKRHYRMGFLAMAVLSIGGFMMMPFGTAFAVNNLKIPEDQLFELFMVSGVATLIVMPLVGKLADKIDKFKLFTVACFWMMAVVVLYTQLGPTPLWEVMIFNVAMMAGIMSRMIPSGALMTALPEAYDRGAYMSVSASLQQIAGGIAAAFAGLVVTQHDKTSPLQHYELLGYIMVGLTVLSIILVFRIDRLVKRKTHEQKL